MATVVLPALLACGGPSLYLPLLAFAGAGPTTLLYLFVPPLALLQFRRAEHGKAPARLLPGGVPLLLGLAAVASAMLFTSGTLAVTKLVGL